MEKPKQELPGWPLKRKDCFLDGDETHFEDGRFVTLEELKDLAEAFWLEGMHDGINNPMADKFEMRWRERYGNK